VERRVGDRIVLVGTAHVSERSVAEVREAIDRHAPDIVAVELDPAKLVEFLDWARYNDPQALGQFLDLTGVKDPRPNAHPHPARVEAPTITRGGRA